MTQVIRLSPSLRCVFGLNWRGQFFQSGEPLLQQEKEEVLHKYVEGEECLKDLKTKRRGESVECKNTTNVSKMPLFNHILINLLILSGQVFYFVSSIVPIRV